MIRSLREYIIDVKKDILENALGQLKKNLDFDSTAIDHLHLALYSFQVDSAKLRNPRLPPYLFPLSRTP